MTHLGDFATSGTVHLKWNTQGADGASITRATNGSIRVYKGSSTTERSSSAGITDTEDFDSLTGVHHLTIDLSDNTDAGFYAAGNEYQIVLVGATIDGKTVNANLASFSIERAGGALAQVKALTTSGHIKADVLKLNGVTQSAANLEQAAQAIVLGACVSGSSTTEIRTNLTEATNDHFIDRSIVFISGALAAQAAKITDYDGTNKYVIVAGLTEAPANTDKFVIV